MNPTYPDNYVWLEIHDEIVTKAAWRDALIAAAKIAEANKDYTTEQQLLNLFLEKSK